MATASTINDHGLECLRKSTQTYGDANDPIYNINTRVANTPTVETTFKDRMQRDKFGRMRVSNPETKFDATLTKSINPLIFTTLTATSGTVTYDDNKKAAILSCTSATNSRAVLQTRQYFKYHPAKSSLVFITGNMKGGVANITKRWGQYDDNNGFFFELRGTTLYTIIRSKVSGSVVDTPIAQSAWTVDVFNGNGVSGLNLNLSKQNIYFFEYQWLGTGMASFGASWNGGLYVGNDIKNANLNDGLYSQTATLPLRYEILNTNSGSASTMEVTCMSVISEGGQHKEGITRSVRTGTTGKNLAGSAANAPIISLRAKSTSIGIPIKVLNFEIFLGSADQVLVDIIYNPTLTGASWTSVATDSSAEFDTTATAITGGERLFSKYLTGSGGNSTIEISSILEQASNQALGFDLNGTPDNVTIVVSNISTNTTVFAVINFIELLN